MTEATFRPVEAGKIATLTASIGALTINQTVLWGGNTGGGTGGATATINVRRDQQDLAPEGMVFFAEVSGFDAVPPTDGTTFDPVMHDLHYTWTFGDPGDYAAPVNMITEWRNKNVAYGPFPAHCFTKAGEYRVILTVYEPSSRKSASAFVDIVVRDPNVVCPAATTVVCSSTSNWTGMPVHDVANRTTTFVEAFARLAALKSNGALTRIVFRSGDEFSCTAAGPFLGSKFRNVHVSAHAAGKWILNCTASPFRCYGGQLVPGISISGVDMRGPWDSTTETMAAGYEGHAPTGVQAMTGFTTVHNCSGSGFWQAFHVGADRSVTAIFSEISSTNWEDYGVWVSGQGGADQATAELTGYAAVLGSRLFQDPNALQGANGKSHVDLGNRHGSIRIEPLGFLYVDVVDLFSRNGWSGPEYGVPSDQNIIRDHRNDKRSRAFFSRLMGEGGGRQYSTGPNTPKETVPFASCNAIIDKAYFLASARTTGHMAISSGAFTGRNIILHRPNVGTGSGAFNSSIIIGLNNPNQAEENRSAPVRLYNITIINEMDAAQQGRWGGLGVTGKSTDWVPIEYRGTFFNPEAITVSNIVVHRPNFPGGFVGDGPISNARLGFNARNLGYRWQERIDAEGEIVVIDYLTMDTSFATPANPYSLWRPQPGSPAIGSATGLVAYDDLLGKIRPLNASRGAIEPAA